MGGLAFALASSVHAQEVAPRWIRLADGHEPAAVAPLLAAWNAVGGTHTFRVDEAGGGIWVEEMLHASDWEPGTSPAEWRLATADIVADRGRGSLRWEGTEIGVPTVGEALPYAHLRRDQLVLRLPAEGPPPAEARLSAWFERGAHGRVTFEFRSPSVEDGLVVWPGERVERRVDLAANSVLRFVPRAVPMLAPARVTFRVWLEERLVYEASLDAAEAAGAPVVVPLGPEARPQARLSFAVEGPPALTAFVRPVLGPAAIGAVKARPFAARRPDVVLFLADTFRADLMQLYGAESARTPNLDALAQRSVRFLASRASATWTLPTHASLFTGTAPPQHGAERKAQTFPAEFDTLAELFQRAGYRTGAVTDGLYLNRAYGMDQGFESFDTPDGPWSLAKTLAAAREFVGEDDGRPLFLFVHTYRTHWPYRVGREENSKPALALRRATLKLLSSTQDSATRQESLAAASREMHELYRHGAAGLDAEFGPWFDELAALGLFAHGYFVFTSDHGEAFGEHGTTLHGGLPYEEQARVPLFIHGGGVEPRAVPFGVNTLDLAPTLAARCGLERSSLWSGRDLFTLAEERTLFCTSLGHDERLLGVTEGPFKLLANGSPFELPGSFFAAHALESDRGENLDLGQQVPWAAALGARAARAWQALAAPLSPAAEVELDEESLEELRQLGY